MPIPTTQTPPDTAPLRRLRPPPPPIPPQRTTGVVSFIKPTRNTGHRVLLYGPGGIGKTTLCQACPGPVAFIDLDESLGRLPENNDLSVVPVSTWQELRSALQSSGWDGIKTVVIDTVTKAEELCVAHTLASIKTEKGTTANSVESYGYGKGFTHVFETFLPILSDLDRHTREGRNVVMVAHDCTTEVPNPAGEDWLRYEPRLQSPGSGKNSIRLRAKEWADHVLFMGYDVDVKEGKGRGCGTRTIYTSELPHCMAKSRTTQATLTVGDPINGGADIWSQIIK